MKKSVLVLLLTFAGFFSFAQPAQPLRLPPRGPRLHYHGKYLESSIKEFRLVNVNLFCIHQIESEENIMELHLFFSNPLNPESLKDAYVQLNDAIIPVEKQSKFTRDGTKVKLYVPESAVKNEGNNFLIVKNFRSYNEIKMKDFEYPSLQVKNYSKSKRSFDENNTGLRR